ncbi:hypothetical protein ACFIQF_10605, partial [Comamonas sp. J-3]|uniref:hypothetical protein n=1 Tax=Comamonas trifloxystrobinivorans TaxID=3350256 RepID=UPI0037295558
SIAGFAGLTHAASLPLEEQRFMQQRPLDLEIKFLSKSSLHLNSFILKNKPILSDSLERFGQSAPLLHRLLVAGHKTGYLQYIFSLS